LKDSSSGTTLCDKSLERGRERQAFSSGNRGVNAVLLHILTVLFFAIAPGLLLIRFFRPRLLPRPALLVAAAALGGAAFYAHELVQRAEMTAWVQRAGLFDPAAVSHGEGMVVLMGPRPVDFVLGGVLELVYLLLWLVPYGIIQIVRTRRGPVRKIENEYR
jgi:hypothetical protein